MLGVLMSEVHQENPVLLLLLSYQLLVRVSRVMPWDCSGV